MFYKPINSSKLVVEKKARNIKTFSEEKKNYEKESDDEQEASGEL